MERNDSASKNSPGKASVAIKMAMVVILALAVIAAVYMKSHKAVSVPTQSLPGHVEPGLAQLDGDLAPQTTDAPAKPALPRLLEVGADKCVPCRMMQPILKELREDYAGGLEVDFLDVWKDPAAGRALDIRIIPVQIFYDASGKELFRHEGFYPKEKILAKWKELGVNLGNAEPAAKPSLASDAEAAS